MKRKDLLDLGARHYLAYDFAAITFVFVGSVIAMIVMYAILKNGGIGVLLILRITIIGLIVSEGPWLISMIQIITIDVNGITYRAPFQKRKEIQWKSVCCCGEFYHDTYLKKKKFFYFSTKPLPGGINYLNLTTMPKPTDTFLYVAEQRDVESVIKHFYPKLRP